MTLNFPATGLVTATVHKVFVGRDYFFARNGDPGDIYCGTDFGGNRLELTEGGVLILAKGREFRPPDRGDKIVLVRGGKPGTRSYTQAIRWVHAKVWQQIQTDIHLGKIHLFNPKQLFRVIGFDHRINDEPQPPRDVVLVEELTAEELFLQYPKVLRDKLSQQRYDRQVGRLILSCQFRWEKLSADGIWVECGDPRPTLEQSLLRVE